MFWEEEMPTLIDRIHDLTEQIKMLADSKVTEDEAKGFSTRAQEFSDPSNAISVPTRRYELFIAKGIRVESPASDSRKLKRTIDELAAKYEADPRSILDPNTNWRYAIRNQLTQLADRVSEDQLVAWRSYLTKMRPHVDQGLMLVLRSSPAYADHANHVQELDSEFDQLNERLPVTQEQIDRPEGLATELLLAIDDLPQDIPEPVRELFRAINQRTATAAHLTDDALGWLRENALLETLRISWGPV